MQGTYRIFKNGLLVAEQSNLITTQGRGLILRYLAGNLGTFAGVIAAGTSPKAPTVADTKLGFEFTRGRVVLGAANVPAGQVVYKASMPLDAGGAVWELGLYPTQRGSEADYAGQVFVTFESGIETMTGGGVNTTNYRIGKESYSATAAANGSTTVSVSSAVGNFIGYSASDVFSLAYFLNDANTSSITVRLKVDNSNYFSYNVSTGTATGYFVTDWAKSAFTATGTPTWENITSADFIINARAGGATTVQLDGLRVSDTDVYPDYGLVSRAVLATPIIKVPGEQMDIEYSLGFVV